MIRLPDGTWLSESPASDPLRLPYPDAHPQLQAEIDALAAFQPGESKTLRLKAGYYWLTHPLLIPAGDIHLVGDPSDQTVVSGNFTGWLIVARKPRGNITTGPSLLPGPGAAMQIGPDKPSLNLSTHPSLDVSSQTEFTAELSIRRRSALEPFQERFYVGSFLILDGANKRIGWGIGESHVESEGQLWIWWDTVAHRVAATISLDNPHEVELSLKDGIVRTFLDGVKVLEFPSATPTVPQLGYAGVEQTWIGLPAFGPAGGLWAYDAADAFIDGLRISRIARHTEDFTPPTVKPTWDIDTLLVINFETDGEFVTGTGEYGQKVYFVDHHAESQMGGVQISNLTLLGTAGASGVLLYDCFSSEVNITTNGTWQGIAQLGSCYGNRGTVDLNTASYGFVQGTQASASQFHFKNVCAGAWSIYLMGSVSGRYTGLESPGANNYGGTYVFFADAVQFVAPFQIDDEQQAPNRRYAIYSAGGRPRFFGAEITTTQLSTVPIYCGGGGSVDLLHCRVTTPTEAPEIVHFAQQPTRPATSLGLVNIGNVPLTDHPEWLKDFDILGLDA